MALARWTSATSTISMATMFSRSSRPAAVPLDDRVHRARRSCRRRRACRRCAPAGIGHHDQADRIAAGAPSTEAITDGPARRE